MVHIARHWNWPGKEGEIIDLWCYSNCEEVELFQDGNSLGKKKSVCHGHVSWDVTYFPGTLTAVGYIDGEKVCEHIVRTAGNPAVLKIDADRSVLKADGEDVVFLTVSVLDSEGAFCPESDNKVNIEVDGTGSLIGVANGDARSHESCRGTSLSVYKGLMLAVVQTVSEPGEIRITVSSDGLGSAVAVCRSED